MSKLEKLKKRLYAYPNDFTWEELIKVLAAFGFKELNAGKTSGSRRKFIDEHKNLILLHEPHPKNIIKQYAIKQVVEQLKQIEEKSRLKNIG